MKKTSTAENGLIWFGAAVSIAEILTGVGIAPLGFKKGIAAILLGHLIGCVLLFLAGLIGGKTGKSAMETVKMSFGKKGSLIFAVLNIVQLIGWTSIMIYDGMIAANGIFSLGNWVWASVIGGLIILWILVGIKNLGRLNTAAMSLLFVLSIILSVIIFNGQDVGGNLQNSISFGAAVELSVAMPLSWLPLISDYTKEAQNPKKASLVSAITYFTVSSWMYIIGMGAAITMGTSDIVEIILKSGSGIAGLLIILFSTVTTTFMDAFSAGVSAQTLSGKLNEKWTAVAVTVIGIISAVVYPLTDITDFLYLIGSVFAPMIAIQIADYFIIKKNSEKKEFNLSNIIIWLAGVVIYRGLMGVDIILGSTFFAMLITIIICVVISMIKERFKNRKNPII